MLDPETGRTLFAREPGHVLSDEQSTSELISIIFGVVRRQILVVGVLALVGAALGVFFLLKSQALYTATSTLLINTHKFEIFQQPAVSDQLPMQAVGAVENQVELLRSDEIALRVIKRLNLVDNPEFIRLDRQSLITRVIHKLVEGKNESIVSDNEKQNLALKVFGDGLSVDRVGVTYAIEIKYRSDDPELAAQIANAVSESYIDLQRSSEGEAARQASEWLEERMPELRAKREASQKAVVDYKQLHGLVEMTGGQLIADQRVADANLKLSAARDQALQAKSRFEQFASLNGSNLLGALASASNGNGVTPGSLDKLRTQYFDVVSKLGESTGTLGANNPVVISLRNQEAQLRSEMLAEIQRLKNMSESDYSAAQVHELNLKKDFDVAVEQAQGAKEAQVKLEELEASARAYQDLYTTYVSRYNASLQQGASPVAEATVITPASSIIQRDYKKAVQVAALFPLAGVMLGLSVALLREILASRGFLTSTSVQSQLQIACIGLLPRTRGSKQIGRRRQKARKVEGDPRTLVRGNRRIGWTVVDRPFSRFSEGVRSIKFAIDSENRARSSSRVIGVTSALASEGKSTVALAIAQMMSCSGASTVLVDCDLRNPSLTRSIAPNAAIGLVELAFGRTSIEDVVWKDHTSDMAFLPAIDCATPFDPPSALSSVQMRRVFDALRERYQFVIVDLSPLVPVVDVCATVDFIDGFVFVIEWGQTAIDIVKRALRAAPQVSNAVIGAVLNKVDVKELKTYDPYTTTYYFSNRD